VLWEGQSSVVKIVIAVLCDCCATTKCYERT